MGGKKSHTLTFVYGQGDVDQVTQNIDDLLTKIGHSTFICVECFEGGIDGEKCLKRSYSHHNHHHDGKNRNGVSGHVHDEQIHGNL